MEGDVVECTTDETSPSKSRCPGAMHADAIDDVASRKLRVCLLVQLAACDDDDVLAIPRERERQIAQHLAGCGMIRMKKTVYEKHSALAGFAHRLIRNL